MSIRLKMVLVCIVVAITSGLFTGVGMYFLVRVQAGSGPGVVPTIVVLSVALLVFSAWMGYRVAQPLVRRLYDIEEGASLMASGLLYHRVDTMQTTDEVGRLAEQFNRMGTQIENHVTTLRKLADENKELAIESERVAVLEERQRLARELHDSVSQQLFALTMLASSAQKQFDVQSTGLPKTLNQLSDLANAAQKEMRALLLHLRPVELEGRGLVEATDAFLQAVSERHGIACELNNHLETALDPGLEENCFRILQEAVANVLKHAQATRIQVSLDEDERTFVLTIVDDGIGMSELSQTSGKDSYGLRAMRERAASLGGHLYIWSREPGTGIEVRVPKIH